MPFIDDPPLQFNMAKLVPGKEEFHETLRYFSKKIQLTGVDVRLNTKVDAPSLLSNDPDSAFDTVILATGVTPRKLSLEGSDHPKVRYRVCLGRAICRATAEIIHALLPCECASPPRAGCLFLRIPSAITFRFLATWTS